MNTSMQGIIVNNCQYAPVYLIQDPATTQANTYVFATNNVPQAKPICDNLKSFYENSGNIENGLMNVDTAVKPTVTKKKDSILIGNNLKLASFLLPKNVNKQYLVENVDIKPQLNTPINNGSAGHTPVNIVPKIDMDRKIVKVKDIPVMSRSRPDKLLPKIKPKESGNQLSEDQVDMVKQALKVFKDPDKPGPDPPPAAKYLYKVVSPKDLRIVGHKKYVVKDKKLTKIPRRVTDDRAARHEPPAEIQTKFTRSGRKVKLPKQIVAEESPHKAKKKTGTIVSCVQCSAEFGSLYRLQKHYELMPTHIPAKIHSNLFHCLVAIVRGAGGDRAGMLLQQLHQLVGKLRALLPCLLRSAAPGQPCSIAGDVARVFGMTPGKYYIDVDALNCVKDKDGFCIHNPPKNNQGNKEKPSARGISNDDMLSVDSDTENCARINSVAKWPTVSKRIWKKKTHESSAKKMRLKSEGDTLIDLGTEELNQKAGENVRNRTASAQDDVIKVCESAAGGPDISNMRSAHFNNLDNHVQFHSAHFDIRSSPIKSSSTVFRKFQINPSKMSNYEVEAIRSLELLDKADTKQVVMCTKGESTPHVLMSTEETPSPEVSAMQADVSASNNELRPTLPRLERNLPDALPNSDLHVNDSFDITLTNTEHSLHDIFKVGVDLACKEDSNIDSDLKDWIISTCDKSRDSLKTLTGAESARASAAGSRRVDKSISDNIEVPSLDETDSRLSTTHGESVLNFLDNLSNDLVYPETEIRNNGVDFQLDLFTFHNTV